MSSMQQFHEIYAKNHSIVDLSKFIKENKKLFKDTSDQVKECFEKIIEGDNDGLMFYQDVAVITAIVACDFYRHETEPNEVITKKLIAKVEKDIKENAKSTYIKYTLIDDTAKFEITEEETDIQLESDDFINMVKDSLIPKAVELNSEHYDELEEPDKKKETQSIKDSEEEEINDQKEHYKELISETKKQFTERIDSLKTILDSQIKALQDAFNKSKDEINEEMELVVKMHKEEMDETIKGVHENTSKSKENLKNRVTSYAQKAKMYKKGSSPKTIAKISSKEVVTKDLSLIRLILVSIFKNKTAAQEELQKFINNNNIVEDKPAKKPKKAETEKKVAKKVESESEPEVKKVESDSEPEAKKEVKKTKKVESESEDDKPIKAKKPAAKHPAKKAPVKTIKKYNSFDDISADSD